MQNCNLAITVAPAEVEAGSILRMMRRSAGSMRTSVLAEEIVARPGLNQLLVVEIIHQFVSAEMKCRLARPARFAWRGPPMTHRRSTAICRIGRSRTHNRIKSGLHAGCRENDWRSGHESFLLRAA